MATILLKIQASQFSIFLLAIHHIAVNAEADTKESRIGVSELVNVLNITYSMDHPMMHPAIPIRSSFLVHQDMAKTS